MDELDAGTVTEGAPKQDSFPSGRVLSRVFARALASGFQALTLVLVARVVGPSQFGVFALTLSIGYIVSSVVGFGASTRVLRLSAESDQVGLAATLFAIRAVGSVLTFSATILIATRWGFSSAIVAGAALAASDLMVEYTQAHMAGSGHLRLSSVLVVVQRGFVASVVLITYLLSQFDFWWFALATLLVLLLALVYPIRRLVRPTKVWATVRDSGGYWAASLVGNLRQGEPLVVGAVLGTAATGGYAVASRLTNPLLIFTSALQTVLVPELARSRGTLRFQATFSRLLRWSVVSGLIISLSAPLIAAGAVLLLGPAYAEARAIIIAMVIATGFSAVSQAFQCRFVALGRPGTSAAVIGASTILGLGLIWVVGANFGAAFLWVPPLVTQIILLAGMVGASAWSSSRPAEVGRR